MFTIFPNQTTLVMTHPCPWEEASFLLAVNDGAELSVAEDDAAAGGGADIKRILRHSYACGPLEGDLG